MKGLCNKRFDISKEHNYCQLKTAHNVLIIPMKEINDGNMHFMALIDTRTSYQ